MLTPLRLRWLIQQSEYCLSMGIDKLKSYGGLINLTMFYSNIGQLYRNISHYSSQYIVSYEEFKKTENFTNMVNFIFK